MLRKLFCFQEVIRLLSSSVKTTTGGKLWITPTPLLGILFCLKVHAGCRKNARMTSIIVRKVKLCHCRRRLPCWQSMFVLGIVHYLLCISIYVIATSARGIIQNSVVEMSFFHIYPSFFNFLTSPSVAKRGIRGQGRRPSHSEITVTSIHFSISRPS